VVDQRISFITLGVRDLDASRAFFLDGLGWEASHDSEEVLMLRVGEHLVLSLWDRSAMEAEIGPLGSGAAPLTISHNVATRACSSTSSTSSRVAGARAVLAPEDRAWGGYTGYFADPSGYRWEVAWNPGPVGQEVLP
jgi:uncharacterized protein